MSVTLWIDEEKDETIELGPTLPFYKSFQEIADLVGPDFLDEDGRWYALSALAEVCETQDDANPVWLVNLEEQAKEFLSEYNSELSEDTKWVLQQIIDYGKDNTLTTNVDQKETHGHGKGSHIPGPLPGSHHEGFNDSGLPPIDDDYSLPPMEDVHPGHSQPQPKNPTPPTSNPVSPKPSTTPAPVQPKQSFLSRLFGGSQPKALPGDTPASQFGKVEGIHNSGLRHFGDGLQINGDIKGKNIQSHIKDLAKVPDHVMADMADAGVKIHLGDGSATSMDGMKELAGYKMPDGRSFDDMGGTYNPDDNAVIAGHTKSSGCISLPLHEFGHAVGHKTGHDEGEDIESHHARLFGKLPPYLQDGGTSDLARGRKELFAEGFAHVIKDRKGAEKVYDKAFCDWMHHQVLGNK